MSYELKNNGEIGDFDLFEIAYSLWKNKITLLSAIIAGVIIAFAFSIFETKNNSVYVEIGPNTTDTVFLYQLNSFNIDTSQIFRNYLANIKTRKIIERTLRVINPSLSKSDIDDETTSIISQIQVKIAENELASEFQETSGFKFYRVEYISDGAIDSKKKFIRSLIDENNKYFINIFNTAMDARIDYETEVYMTELKAKAEELKNNSKNQASENKIQQQYIHKSNKLVTEKYATQKLQGNFNEFSIDLAELQKNLEIARSLGIKKPTFDTPANIELGAQSDLNSYSFFLGTDVLSQKIQTIKDVLAKKDSPDVNIRSKIDEEEIRLLKKNQEISLRQRQLQDTNEDEKRKQELKFIDEQMRLSEIYMDAAFRDKIIIRNFMREFMNKDGFMLVEETSSIASEEEKNLMKYLIIFITFGFILASAWIFFNEARIKRNVSL